MKRFHILRTKLPEVQQTRRPDTVWPEVLPQIIKETRRRTTSQAGMNEGPDCNKPAEKDESHPKIKTTSR